MDIIVTFVMQVIDIFLHLDVHLAELVVSLGPMLYVLLFIVVFCETGLVVTPFLPGDSLLFAVGALAALPATGLNVWLLGLLLFVAAVLGDATNYAIGKHFGPKIFKSESSRFLNKAHLEKTTAFYNKHGGKTIILARFIPIIRTFAPFVAGIGRMEYRQFGLYNIAGAALWIVPFLGGGFLLGNIPSVKRNFHIIVIAIIVISVLPAVFEFWKTRREKTVVNPVKNRA